jgi:hypothetical protein
VLHVAENKGVVRFREPDAQGELRTECRKIACMIKADNGTCFTRLRGHDAYFLIGTTIVNTNNIYT